MCLSVALAMVVLVLVVWLELSHMTSSDLMCLLVDLAMIVVVSVLWLELPHMMP